MTDNEKIAKHREKYVTCQLSYSWTLCVIIRRELGR